MDDKVFELLVGRFDRHEKKIDTIHALVQSHDKDITFVKKISKSFGWVLVSGAALIGFGKEVRTWLDW